MDRGALNLILAVFLVVLGVSAVAVALFLILAWTGLLLLGGVLTAAVGLLVIPVDRGER